MINDLKKSLFDKDKDSSLVLQENQLQRKVVFWQKATNSCLALQLARWQSKFRVTARPFAAIFFAKQNVTLLVTYVFQSTVMFTDNSLL
jgi:hypothetical protein